MGRRRTNIVDLTQWPRLARRGLPEQPPNDRRLTSINAVGARLSEYAASNSRTGHAMSKIGLDNKLWILVCDGRKALLLENAGDRVYPKLETRETFEHPEFASHDLGTDAPGRSQSSGGGGGRSSVDQTDLHRQANEDFLKDVSAHLDRSVAADHIRKLISGRSAARHRHSSRDADGSGAKSRPGRGRKRLRAPSAL